jgi:hypothetical protein
MKSCQPIGGSSNALQWFNEKADKLESSLFAKTILSEPLTYHVEWDMQGGGGAWHTGPQGESIDHFVNTFRQFLQKKDPISFRNIARHYDGLRAAGLIPENLANEFVNERNRLNRFLDSETNINVHDQQLTRRYIWDVFVNGAIAHTDKEKRDVYDQWRAVPPLFPMIEREFIAIMGSVLAVIFAVRNLNKRTLEELGARNP